MPVLVRPMWASLRFALLKPSLPRPLAPLRHRDHRPATLLSGSGDFVGSSDLSFCFFSHRRELLRGMATATQAFKGNMKKALAGLRRINLDGLRWRVFDAKGQVLGRLASQIATVVQGKDKPTYTPYREDGDMCVVLNAKDVCVTGRKLKDKVYYWHTGYVGHLKQRNLKDQLEKDPTEVIRKAVLRMLPRNKLRDDRDRKLRIFAGSEHPFVDRPLEPYVIPPRNVREMRPRARRALIRAQKKAEESSTGASRKRKDDNIDPASA